MRKKIFLSVLLSFMTLPAFSYVLTEELSREQYLINQGYSPFTAELVQLESHKANGKPFPVKVNEEDTIFPVNVVRRLFIYLDPSLYDGNFARHNTRPTQSFDDL